MKSMTREKGFSLFLVILILAGIAALMVAGGILAGRIQSASNETRTSKRLMIIRDAMNQY